MILRPKAKWSETRVRGTVVRSSKLLDDGESQLADIVGDENFVVDNVPTRPNLGKPHPAFALI